MKLPVARVWQAGQALLDVLPGEDDVPKHRGGSSSVEDAKRDGIRYVTASNGIWHVDWPQVFSYVVVRGGGVLQVSTAPFRATGRSYHLVGEGVPKRSTVIRLPVTRGTVIQLWAMCPHRFIGKFTTFVDGLGPRQRKFCTPSEQERLLRRYLVTKKQPFKSGR